MYLVFPQNDQARVFMIYKKGADMGSWTLS